MIEKWEYFDADSCKGLAVEFTRVLDTGRLKLEKTMMLSRQSLRSLLHTLRASYIVMRLTGVPYGSRTRVAAVKEKKFH